MDVLHEIEQQALQLLARTVDQLIEERQLDFFYWRNRWLPTVITYVGSLPPPGYDWFTVKTKMGECEIWDTPQHWWAVGDTPSGVVPGAVHRVDLKGY